MSEETPDIDSSAPAAEVDTSVPPAGLEEASAEAPPAGEPTPEPIDWDARITEWGGEETIEDALAIYQGLGDPDGVAQLFISAGRSLGLGDREMTALINGEPISQATADKIEDSFEDDDLDTVMTKREFMELLNEQVIGPQQEAAQRQAAEAYEEHIRSTITGTLDSLGVSDDEALRKAVLTIANDYVEDDSDESIAKAIQTGYEVFQATIEAEAKRYVESKQQVRDTSPKPLAGGGATPGGEEVDHVTYEQYGSDVLEEAIRRARRRLGA